MNFIHRPRDNAHRLDAEDRLHVQDSLAQMLEKNWPIADVIAEDSKGSEGLTERRQIVWSQLVEIGLVGTSSDELCLGMQDVLMVSYELGKAYCRLPYVSTVLAQWLLNEFVEHSEALRKILESVHSGHCKIAAVLEGENASRRKSSLMIDRNRLSGQLHHVEDLSVATHILVVTQGGSLGLLALSQSGIEVAAQSNLGGSGLNTIHIDNAEVLAFNLSDEKCIAAGTYLKLMQVASCLGAAQRALDLAVEYAQIRRQFGKVIGSFQAIQHKLVNCLVNIDGIRLLLDQAAVALDSENGSSDFYCLSVVAFAGDNLRQTILEIHHTMGAVGFSEEHELTRYFRLIASTVSSIQGGRPAREGLADLLLSDHQEGRLPDLNLGNSAEQFRLEVRQWLREHWDVSRQKTHFSKPFNQRGYDEEFSRAMGEKGWIAISWSREYGGQERSALEHYVLVEEMDYAGAPVYAHIDAGELIGPALLAFGTEQQKQEFLPAFQRGEREFCLGYSEPESGSDLASLSTTAVKEGDQWVINGQKIWTTRGAESEYIWLAVKTDSKASPPHAGISILMVPLDAEGITIRPTMALYGHTYCNIFFDDVRVAESALVGEVNKGWKVITHALTAERILMGGSVARIRKLFESAVACLITRAQWESLRTDPVIRDQLGRLAAEVMVARLMAVRGVQMVERGETPLHEAAMTKVYSGELMERLSGALMDIFGVDATYEEGVPGTPLDGAIEQVLRRSIMMVIGGGTAEIQRNLIAVRGLGLPRSS